MRYVIRNVFRAAACCLLLVPLLFSIGADPADAQAEQTCLVAGNGLSTIGPFPASQATFTGFQAVSEIRVDAANRLYALVGFEFGAEPNAVVRIVDGGAEVVVSAGDTVAGVVLGQIIDFDLTQQGDLLIASRAPDALVRIGADGTEENLTIELRGFTARSISAAADGTIYLPLTGPSGDVLLRANPGGPPTVLLPVGAQVEGEPIKRYAVSSAGVDGVWVVATLSTSSRLLFVGNDASVTAGESFSSPQFPPFALRADDTGDLFYAVSGELRRASVGGLPVLVQRTDELVSGRTPGLIRALEVRDGTAWFAAGNQIYRSAGDACPPVPFNDGPATCLVADQSTASEALSADESQFSPLGLAVDGTGEVYSTWFAGTSTAGVGDEVVLRTGTDGITETLLIPDQVVSDDQIGLLRSIAVTATTGEVFVRDAAAGSRVLRRDSAGEWAEVLAPSSVIGEFRLTNPVRIAASANNELYASESDNEIVTIDLAANRSRRLSTTFDLITAFAVSPNTQPSPTVWVATRDGIAPPVLRKQNPTTGAFTPLIDFATTTLNGATVEVITQLAPAGDGVIASVRLDNGAWRLVRIDADGTIQPIIDEFMLLDDRVLDSVAGLAVGFNGDIYIADASHDRIIRLPVSGDCSTPLPPVVDVAASVNCDDQANIIDALFIVQYEVTVRTGVFGCPLENPATELNLNFGDINGDGQVNVIDALLIAQCEVEVPNSACPRE